MATIVTRSGKGSPLTHAEVDANFTNLNTDKLELSGGTMTGNLSFGDNDKAIFGDSSDLQIYHDGFNSFIRDSGTGYLNLLGTGRVVIGHPTNSDVYLNANYGGDVELFFANSKKLSTTSTGIDVTGTVTADGLTVDGNLSFNDTGANVTITGPNNFDLIINGQGNQAYEGIRLQSSGVDAVKIDADGDVMFYEDTGTTAKFFWDASAESLGIGTTSPDRAIKIHKDNAYFWVADAAGGNVGFLGGSGQNDGLMRLYEGSGHTARVEIHSDADSYFNGGNVGIGTSSPSNLLHLKDEGYQLLLEDTSSGNTGEILVSDTSLYFFSDRSNSETNSDIRFSVDASERMRIDSSGNLLVGKTAAGTATSGFQAGSDGFTGITRDGDTPLRINRETDDGTIVDFRKDNAPVGSIGATSGRLYIGDGTVALRIVGDADEITPWNATGNTNRDAAIALGNSTNRFTDLYLSGGVYLGGTGSANKLDDYEEGTWTPTIKGATTAGTATYLARWGNYTKIGNLVTVRFYINVNSFTGTGTMLIAGLPFTSGSDSGIQAGSFYPTRINANITLTSDGYLSIPVTENTTQGFFVSTSATSPASSSSINCDAAFAGQFEGSYFV